MLSFNMEVRHFPQKLLHSNNGYGVSSLELEHYFGVKLLQHSPQGAFPKYSREFFHTI